MGFETRQLTLDKLFSDQFKFSFPPFQRPYRWTTAEAEALLRDLLDASRLAAPYFLGSFVVSGSDDKALSVIDGRQRLTTLFVLFAVLRDLEGDPAVKGELDGLLRDEGNLVKRVEPGYRLRLGAADAAWFDAWVGQAGATARPADDGTPERHLRLLEVTRALREGLSALDGAARRQLVQFALHRCEIIVVKAGDDAQALRLFQVLNGRGMELSQADLARPQLLADLPAAEQLVAAELWDHVDERLGSAGVDTLLRALVFVHDGVWLTPEQPLADPLVSALRAYGVARFHAEELERYAEALLRLRRGELPFTERRRNPNPLVRALSWLGRSDREWQEWLPVALECVVSAGDDDERLFALVRGVDRLFWVAFLCELDETARRAMGLAAVRELRQGLDPLRDGGALRPSPKHAEAAKAALLRPLDKAQKRTAICRRLELELEIEGGGELHPDLDRAIADFVLPVVWPADHRAWTDVFDRDAHRAMVALLGNAVLASRTPERSAQLAAFVEKKKLYTKFKWPRPFEMTKDVVAKYTHWTPPAVQERTERMARRLLDGWSI